MDFIRDYQELIVAVSGAISTALLAMLGFLYHSIITRQREHESRVSSVLDDHEQRLRQSVAKSDWESLVAEVRGLKDNLQSAIQASSAHNSRTRVELHNAMLETERRLADKIDSAFARRGEH
jgi:hypothetical protein